MTGQMSSEDTSTHRRKSFVLFCARELSLMEKLTWIQTTATHSFFKSVPLRPHQNQLPTAGQVIVASLSGRASGHKVCKALFPRLYAREARAVWGGNCLHTPLWGLSGLTLPWSESLINKDDFGIRLKLSRERCRLKVNHNQNRPTLPAVQQ